MNSEGRTLDQLTKSELQILQVNTLVKQKRMFEIVMEVVACILEVELNLCDQL
jgi:hypothetical protein